MKCLLVYASDNICVAEYLFTHPPPLGGTDVYMFYSVFFLSTTKYETTVLGNGWTDFHETFTKR